MSKYTRKQYISKLITCTILYISIASYTHADSYITATNDDIITNNAEFTYNDPFEKYNRPVFEFNNIIDKLFLTPISSLYRDLVPKAIKYPFENIVEQFKYPVSMINYSFQGKWEPAVESLIRFSTNMIITLGTGEVIENKKYSHSSFNDTLKYYDFNNGPYIVLPFTDGNTVRGHLSRLTDNIVNPIKLNKNLHNKVLFSNLIINRSHVLNLTETLENTSLDYYSAIRNITLQKSNVSNTIEPDINSNNYKIDFSDEDLD